MSDGSRVRYLDVSGGVDEKVFRLEVSVHDVECLEVLERQDHLARVQLRLVLTATAYTTSSVVP